MVDEIITYGIVDIEIREGTKEGSKIFVAATEGGVRTWLGKEHLDMDGLDTTRFLANPQILNTHKRDDIENIVGRGALSEEDRKLVVDVEFTDITPKGEMARKLVDDGFLKAVSIGFISTKAINIDDGEEALIGKRKIIGPARIVREWELFEISVVPVGADADALKRSLLDNLSIDEMREISERYNSKENDMADDDKKGKTEPQGTEPQTPAKRDPEPPKPELSKTDERIAKITAITPPGYEDVAERCIIGNKTIEETRQAFMDENARRHKPIGTPEPIPAGSENDEGDDKELKVKDLNDKQFTRSILG